MKEYLLVFLSVVLLAFSFIILKFYQQRTDTTTKSSALFNIYSATCSFLLFFAINGFTMKLSLFSVVMAILQATSGFVYSLIGYRILAKGSVALYTLFLMSGGMVVPAVIGWLFLDEPLTLLRVLGVLIIVAAIVINNSGLTRPHPRVLLMCVAVFFLNGLVSVFAKLHQIHADLGAVGTTDYVLISTSLTWLMAIGTYLSLHFRDRKTTAKPQKRKGGVWLPLVIVLLSSAVGSASSFLQLEGAKNLPASVLYPMITGGSIILSGLFSMLFFREKISKREWVGIAVCTVGTCFFL